MGVAAAAFHSVPLEPRPGLPKRNRHMPWKNLARRRRDGEEPTTPLLDAADERAAASPVPDDDLVLVHGDLWAGNMLFDRDEYVGTIDWDAAGAGSYGVDLGSLRLDSALFYGLGVDRPHPRRMGSRQLAAPRRTSPTGTSVAALNVEADISGSVSAMQSTGRVDLDGGRR